MKKMLLSAAALILAGTVSFAQSKKKDPLASHLSLGPVVSFGHSWTSHIGDNVRFKPSPALGVGLVYSKNEHWGFGAQLLVSHEGFKQDVPRQNGGFAPQSVNPVYLRVPLVATYFFGKFGDKVRPKIYAGPSVAVRVAEQQFYDGEDLNLDEDTYGRADFGLTGGLGANIRVGKLTWLNLDAGYYHGLIDVIPGATAANNTNEYNGNRNIRINVGLMWGL